MTIKITSQRFRNVRFFIIWNVCWDELPNIEHRMCVRYICGNLKVKHVKKKKWNPSFGMLLVVTMRHNIKNTWVDWFVTTQKYMKMCWRQTPRLGVRPFTSLATTVKMLRITLHSQSTTPLSRQGINHYQDKNMSHTT